MTIKQNTRKLDKPMPTGDKTYLVRDHTSRGKVFGTLAEAMLYCEDYRRATHEILSVVTSDRAVTHVHYGCI